MKNIKLWAKQNSPEILIAFGIINSIVSIVAASVATKKATNVVNPLKINLVKVHSKMDELEDGDPKKLEYKVLIRKMYAKAIGKLILLYTPAAISFALSVGSIVYSHKILKGRNLALAAAFTTLKTGYDAYRARVQDKLGESEEQELYSGDIIEKIIEKDENGKKKITTVSKPNIARENEPYSQFWGPGQTRYDNTSPGLNMTTLLQAEQWFNQALRAYGYVFLYDVYDYLGYTAGQLGPRTLQASRVLGWMYDPEDKSRNSYISFGIHDSDGKLTEHAKNFQLGLEEFILLTFNVDGDILTGTNGNKAFMEVAMKKGN